MYLQRWHGWCHMKLLPSRRKFCVHLTTMIHVTSCKATYVRCMLFVVVGGWGWLVVVVVVFGCCFVVSGCCCFWLLLLLFSPQHVKGFAPKCKVLKFYHHRTENYPVFTRVCAFYKPGNFTRCGSERVKTEPNNSDTRIIRPVYKIT